jgi:hypothetical protein
MKKGKLKLLIIVLPLIILLSIVISQIWFLSRSNGNNLVFLIGNNFVVNEKIEIFIDGKKVIEDTLNRNFYQGYCFKVSMRNHTALIIINGCKQEIKFNSILYTDIFIDYYGLGDRNIHGQYMTYTIRKTPFYALM